MNHAALTGTTIVVPGSISNLGPSFDALSVAVQLYIRLTIVDVVPTAPDTVEWMFDGQSPSGDNRIATAYDLARARVGTPAPGLRVRVASDIPQTAGLGSSAAAAVAGLRLYEAVTAPRAPLDVARRSPPSSRAIPTTPPRRCSADWPSAASLATAGSRRGRRPGRTRFA